ncbi:hypothetical protein BC351_00600 [Paenibacillus ferrarius]|uniref:Transcriptional regulator n=1 Tax=Paenibacillus ferrarius TaxID=1469647 RepID=A0A1V4HS55_9BACL|nr:RsfA family transcriptional regulator [Paenibacillus ferrarius]OPH61774.1 hypothetical protein BC351_00600 [Paenibacillus ferrarius]
MKEKNREDAWTDSHDSVLAETVLRHIKTGSTQLAAFEQTGLKLNRTAAACGFRWNKELRKQYHNDINEAKLFRVKQKEQKREVFVTFLKTQENNGNHYLDAFNQIIKIAREQAQKFDQLLSENAKLNFEIMELKKHKESANTQTINRDFGAEDIQAFLKIMSRARNLTSLDLNV